MKADFKKWLEGQYSDVPMVVLPNSHQLIKINQFAQEYAEKEKEQQYIEIKKWIEETFDDGVSIAFVRKFLPIHLGRVLRRKLSKHN